MRTSSVAEVILHDQLGGPVDEAGHFAPASLEKAHSHHAQQEPPRACEPPPCSAFCMGGKERERKGGLGFLLTFAAPRLSPASQRAISGVCYGQIKQIN